jgi:mRNA-degrading endonuclease toxin of MazEF toxin-antitoxin module
MAERGRIYRWARNRSMGDAKARPVIVIAPDAATEVLERWVVVPISSDPRLKDHPLAVPLSPRQGTGLERSSFAMAWLPTTVLRQQLQGPIGRSDAEVVRQVLLTMALALDLSMQEAWSED